MKRQMKHFNLRKRQFLELIQKFGELTAREVFILMRFKMGIKNVMVLLKRYHDFGYLHREKNEMGIFVYSLNLTGAKKLKYLLTHE
ncbi:hypothetical protein ES705_08128 [subsurface metagenome]